MEKYLKEKHIELELRVHEPRDVLVDFYRQKLAGASFPVEVIRSVAFSKPGSTARSKFVQEVYFVDGQPPRSESRIKEQLFAQDEKVPVNYRLAVSRETPTDGKIQSASHVRIKYRFRYEVGQWWADFTIVKNVPNIIETIRRERLALFEQVGAGIDKALADKALTIELEFEHRDPAHYSGPTILDMFGANHMAKLCQLLKKRSTLTLKLMLPKVKELTRITFTEEVYSSIGDFWATDKADGVHMVLFTSGANGIAFSSATDIINIGAGLTDYSTASIFECEAIDGKYYIFDVIAIAGQMLTEKLLPERWAAAAGAELPAGVQFKTYKTLDSDYKGDLIALLDDPREYEIDGIIFSSINKKFNDMAHYKWKPLSHMSIDFLCKRSPESFHEPEVKEYDDITNRFVSTGGSGKKVDYWLFSSITFDLFKFFGFSFPRGYQTLFPKKQDRLFPYLFKPSHKPLAYMWSSERADLDGKIVEMGVNPTDLSFRLLRVRDDRADDLASGTYYGNFYEIAEKTLMNFVDPLSRELLLDPQSGQDALYFKKASTGYENMRKYNNNVKRTIIAEYAKNANWVLDSACGRGQDIRKFMSARAQNLIMVDSVPDNISQVVNRKYDLFADRQRARTDTLRIYTFLLDLNDAAAETEYKIRHNGVPFKEVDFIACNLAVHYLIGDMDNFVSMVELFTSPGTRIMLTSIDGAAVVELLAKGDYVSATGKFRISKKDWPAAKFSRTDGSSKSAKLQPGMKIDIKLPFSEEPMEELLVDYDLLTKKFRKFGIRQVATGLFTELKNLSTRDLTAEEIEYVGLHRWIVYEKAAKK